MEVRTDNPSVTAEAVTAPFAQGSLLGKVFCFTCGNDEAQVVATKGEYNLVECTRCGCRWRRSLDPLYERTALVEVDFMDKPTVECQFLHKEPNQPSLFERRNVIY